MSLFFQSHRVRGSFFILPYLSKADRLGLINKPLPKLKQPFGFARSSRDRSHLVLRILLLMLPAGPPNNDQVTQFNREVGDRIVRHPLTSQRGIVFLPISASPVA
jgi:hypothetical protein